MLRVLALVVPPILALVLSVALGASDEVVGIALLIGLLVGVLAWANLAARTDPSLRAGADHPLVRFMNRTRRD